MGQVQRLFSLIIPGAGGRAGAWDMVGAHGCHIGGSMRLVGIGGSTMGGDGDGSVVARGEGGDGVARGGGGPLSLHALSGGQTWGHRVGLQIHWLPEMSIISFWSSVPCRKIL